MLSRVAESLHWMARYIERAEAVSRLVAVHFQALLDGGDRAGWDGVLRMTGDDALFHRLYPEADEHSVLDFLLAHPENPNGVLACLSRARENARGVRDQISSEMWEHLNRLHLLVRDEGHSARGPYALFRQVRDGSQAFEGISGATMTHGEAYEFLQLGRYLERSATTVRTLGARYAEVVAPEEGTAAASLELISLLKSCCAFEPFRHQPGSRLLPGAVVEYLLLSPRFPRAVLFCLNRSAEATALVAPPARDGERLDAPARLLGRLRAELAYLDIGEVLGDGLAAFLDGLLQRIHQVGDEVTRTYFNTRVILPPAKAAGRAQQQQQQQQGQ